MAIYINEDDVKLFQQNGFSYDDVNDTVEHYRESGIKDDEIQKKIDARITQFKNVTNNIPNQKFDSEALGLDKVKPSEIYATPKRNALTDFLNCLQWVKNTSVSAWGEGLNQAEIANLEAKDMFHTINAQEKNRLEELENAPAKQYEKDYKIIENRFADKNADTFIADLPNNTKKAYIEAVKMLPYMWETIKAGGIGGAGGAIIGAGTGLATGLLTTKANTPQLVAQGARTGLSIGSRITGAGKIAELEGGLARSELKQINNDTIEKGGEPLTEAELNALAIGVGTINAGLEVIGLKQVLKTVPNGDKILQYIEKKQLQDLVSDATVRGQLKAALAQYGKALGTETATEMAQEVSNIVAGETAKNIGKIQDKSIPEMLKDNIGRIIDTGKATFGAMVFIGGVGTAAKATSIMVKQGLTKEEAQEKVAAMTPEEQGDFVEENYDTLMEIAKDVDIDEREKVVSQLSEKFQQEGNLLKDKTLANGTAELFTRGLEVVSEANGIPLEELLQNAMPQVVDKGAEENAAAPEVEEKRIINDRLGELEQSFENLTEEDFQNGRYEELESEYEKLTDLKNQGEMYYQEANTAGAESGEYLDAAKEWKEKGTDSQYFKRWFGDSKVVDEGDKPLVVYHRTKNEFSEFDKNLISSNNLFGKGFYFSQSDSKENKQSYGKVRKEVYLSIQNPLQDDTIIKREDVAPYLDANDIDILFKGKDEVIGGVFLFNAFNARYDYNTNIDTSEVLKSLGFDGIDLRNTSGDWVAFYPEQIKSVDNRGTFDSNNPNIYYQSAYHGTPHDFDEFSLDSIGSGEGNQSHGWGLYFAENKDISERYRENISFYKKQNSVRSLDEEYDNLLIDGKPVLENYDIDIDRTVFNFLNAPTVIPARLKSTIEFLQGKAKDWEELSNDEDYPFKDYAKIKTASYKRLAEDLSNGAIIKDKTQGQLFEVDVPESDVLLDEDKSFSEQPEKVQKALKKLSKQYSKDNQHLAKAIKENLTGKDLYYTLTQCESVDYYEKNNAFQFNSEFKERASKKLNELGVKGITYDGRQDGRCYVVFDDKAIKVLKKYYQSAAMMAGINPKQKIKVVDLTDKFAVDKDTTKTDLTEYIRSLVGKTFSSADNKAILNFVKRSKRVGKRDVYIPSHIANSSKVENENKTARNTSVKNIVDLIKNSVLIEKTENNDKTGKPEVDNYLRFYVPVRIKNQIYTIRIVAENNEKNNLFNIESGNVYDVIIDKKMPSKIHLPAKAEQLTKTTSDNIINDNAENFNPDEITIEEMLQDVEDAEGKKYFQDNEGSNADAMKNVKGYYIPAEKIIVLLKNADASTIAHEWAHWYLDLLQNNSNNETIADKLEAVRKFVKNEGEEFTEDQHEKFARAFEVYLRSGYAKNNKLKQVFEDFKNFLWSIYDSVMNIVYKEDGVNKTFTDEEIKNIKDIFDNLLTTERERIKSTVFDKIEEIDNKIEEIKKHEAEEFKELDSIWMNNQELLNRKADKKRYLELAEKMTSRESKEVKDFKKRYKDATLDILSTISGKPRSWVANSRNWEKLQELVANAADNIYGSGGFRAEWSEFYSDAGVSYDTDDISGEYKLGEQALRVLFDGSYNRTFDENYEFADIDKFKAKFDYLAAKVRTLKGTEKEAALEALYSIFENIPAMPDDVFQSISEELMKVGDDYEAQQRDDFNKKTYPSIPVVQQLQRYITQKLNDLKVYNPETRYKMRLNRSHRLYRYIKNVNSVDSAKKQIRRINEYVIDDMRNNQRSLLHKEIQRQIKVNSKVVKVGSLTKGKFDWKTNTVFAELVQLNKLIREEAEKLLGSMLNIDNAEKSEARDSFDENDSGEFNKTGDFQTVLKNEFLQYKSQRLQDLDVTHTIQLLQDILELKDKGRKAKSEEEFLKKTQKWNTKNDLLDVLEETKQSGAQFGANWIAGVGGKLYGTKKNPVANWVAEVGRVAGLNGGVLANWESLLNAIFNKATAQKYSLLGDEARSEVYARKHMLHFYKKAIEIYGFKAPSNWDKFIDFDYMQPIIDLMREYDNEKYTYTQRVFSINTPSGYAESSIEISRAQMITMFAWSLNEELEQRLFNQFGVTQIMDMFESKLSKQDKELAWALVDTCETMREDINEVFIRTTGLSLPKVENYFPSKAERVQSDIDLYHDFFVKSSNPSFIKQRKSCHRIPMKPMAPLEILIPHINKTAKYVILSEKTNFMNQVFKDTAIKVKMQEIWGSENGAKIYQTLINKLAACTFTNYARGTNLVASALDTVSRNYITSRIGFSGKVALGQLLSVVNYAENMPAGEWAKGFKEVIKHPVESFKYMLENCEYLQSRLAGNTQNEIISILTSEKDRFRKLRNFMSTNTKWGDMIAITLGGKPYVDYLMANGMTKEDAFNKFLEDTLRAQQAGTTSSISEWQAAQARNCITRMMFAFQNTTIQYERKFVDTLIQAKKGEISKAEAIKKLFIYKILNPIMFTSFLGNLSLLALFRGLAGGDDDEPVGFLKSVIESIFLSGFGAYGFAGFIAGALIEGIITQFDSDYKHFDKEIPIYSDFNREIRKWVKGDLDFADYVDSFALGVDYGLGIAASKAVNVGRGVGDIMQGEFGVGASRMMGWGKYTSTYSWTGEEPERKRKKRR